MNSAWPSPSPCPSPSPSPPSLPAVDVSDVSVTVGFTLGVLLCAAVLALTGLVSWHKWHAPFKLDSPSSALRFVLIVAVLQAAVVALCVPPAVYASWSLSLQLAAARSTRKELVPAYLAVVFPVVTAVATLVHTAWLVPLYLAAKTVVTTVAFDVSDRLWARVAFLSMSAGSAACLPLASACILIYHADLFVGAAAADDQVPSYTQAIAINFAAFVLCGFVAALKGLAVVVVLADDFNRGDSSSSNGGSPSIQPILQAPGNDSHHRGNVMLLWQVRPSKPGDARPPSPDLIIGKRQEQVQLRNFFSDARTLEIDADSEMV